MSKVQFLGKMPDPFLKEDGTRMTPAEWEANKGKIREKIVDIEYGGMPPRPEVVWYEDLNYGFIRDTEHTIYIRIHAGTEEKQISFILELIVPWIKEKIKEQYEPLNEGEKYPVVLTGDGCYTRNMNQDVIDEICSRGYIAAKFNRLELACDTKEKVGGLYDLYPGRDFTAISAWAWGYQVCMDVFEQLPFVDEKEVAITGHSRGGKTVLLAAAVDERIKYVCPNNSGNHGANSHRCVVTEQGPNKQETERIKQMNKEFPTWMGRKLMEYQDREQDLPYDMHYFGALIAPRYYLQCEGMQDYYINPRGAWQNCAAVKECYRYLGCEDHAAGWFRPGKHRHQLPDYIEFLNFIDNIRAGQPLADHLKYNPYPDMELNFDWGEM